MQLLFVGCFIGPWWDIDAYVYQCSPCRQITFLWLHRQNIFLSFQNQFIILLPDFKWLSTINSWSIPTYLMQGMKQTTLGTCYQHYKTDKQPHTPSHSHSHLEVPLAQSCVFLEKLKQRLKNDTSHMWHHVKFIYDKRFTAAVKTNVQYRVEP